MCFKTMPGHFPVCNYVTSEDKGIFFLSDQIFHVNSLKKYLYLCTHLPGPLSPYLTETLKKNKYVHFHRSIRDIEYSFPFFQLK